MRSRPRIALLAFVAAMLVVHGVVAAWSPLQDDDWKQWMWAERHGSGSLWTWLAGHHTIADVLAYTLAHATWVHVIVSPLAQLALVIGAFTVAMRRLPRIDTWDDVLGVIVLSAMLWIAQPRAGFAFFHRSHVAWQIYGCALAVWTLAPFRCGWRPRGAATVLLAIAAFLVGTTTRQIATPMLIGLALAVRGGERARWKTIAVGALFAGTVVGYVTAPPIEIGKAVYRGFEQALLVLDKPMREGAQLAVLVMLLALGKLVIESVRPSASPPTPDPREALRWFWLWLAICVASLFGPAYSEATVVPATVVLCIAALPFMQWLASARLVRIAIAVIVVGLHVVLWATALVKYATIGAEYRERMALVEATPKGQVAVVHPYSEIQPTWWYFGEDWFRPARQLVAIEGFGVRDIDFDPWFRKLEANPHLQIRLEVEGVPPEQVSDAAPTMWATELSTARTQFEMFTRDLRRAGITTFTARLVVDNLRFPEAAGRPVYAAWYEDGKITAPRVSRTGPDAENWLTITVPGSVAKHFTESYLVRDTGSARLERDNGAYHVQLVTAERAAILGCDAKRCFAVDAFLPRF
jgi:hypothetical protein